ncbi:E3 ubiquitin-protein ligase RSL1-like [Bidens hawaiensis]|uniref:E3 ubiquitin-protein ligase RSL1-like n=1 Tax=Bidens hawaiensis TaxID=980011 RepID=UPI00404AA428
MGNVNQKPQQSSTPTPQQLQLQDSSSSSSSTFTCEICIEPVTLPNTKFNNGNRCVHPFCADCIVKYIQAKLQDNVSDINCPALDCHHSLDPLSCRPKVTHQLFDKWCDVLCDSAVLELDRVYCPNRECSSLVINECGGGSKLKRCVCPNCKKPFCFRCKVSWHAGYRCNEIGEIRDQNDVAFGVLSERKKWMRCPRCRHCVELVKGCSMIRCRCGVKFCYSCGKTLCKCKASIIEWLTRFCIVIMFVSLLILLFKTKINSSASYHW